MKFCRWEWGREGVVWLSSDGGGQGVAWENGLMSGLVWATILDFEFLRLLHRGGRRGRRGPLFGCWAPRVLPESRRDLHSRMRDCMESSSDEPEPFLRPHDAERHRCRVGTARIVCSPTRLTVRRSRDL
jgi:hypothetical protein